MNKWFTPVVVDGTLYLLVAVLGWQMGMLSSDDASKYVSPQVLFWMKFSLGGISAGLLALKMFRSNSYSDSKKQQTQETK